MLCLYFCINVFWTYVFSFICIFTVINYYYFRTNGDYAHEEFLATTELTFIMFEVKAAMKAQVALLHDPNNKSGNRGFLSDLS